MHFCMQSAESDVGTLRCLNGNSAQDRVIGFEVRPPDELCPRVPYNLVIPIFGTNRTSVVDGRRWP